MLKFFTGLATGVALSAALYALTRPVEPLIAAPVPTAVEGPVLTDRPNPFASTAPASTSPHSSVECDSAHQSVPISTPEAPSSPGSTQVSAKPYSPATPSIQEREPSSQAAQDPPLLNDAHKKIIEKDREHPDNISQLYDDFIAEKRDMSWAHRTEQHLHNFFDRIPPRYGYSNSTIECRSSLCMLQIAGNHRTVSARWITLVSQYFEQPHQVEGGRWGFSSAGEQFYILHFFRRQ